MGSRPFPLPRLPAACGWGTAFAGATVLAGWALDAPLLKCLFLPPFAMAPNAALAFLLVGLGLGSEGRSPWARAGAGAAGAIGGLTLLQYLLGVDLGLDQALFQVHIAQPYPGRMAATTALNFAVLGILGSLPQEVRRRGAAWALLPFLLTLAAAIGHLYGSPTLYGPMGRSLMAPSTALLFLVLLGGFLGWAWREPLMGFWTHPGPVGFLSSRFLPALLLATPALGWLRLRAARSGLVTESTSEALFAITCMLLFTGLGAWALRNLRTMEEVRRQQEEEILRFQHVVRELPLGLVVYRLENPKDDESLRLIDANPAAVALLKLDEANALGRLMVEVFPAMKGHADLPRYAEVARTGVPLDLGEIQYGDDRLEPESYAVKAFGLPGRRVGIAFENVSEQVRVRALKDEFVSLVSHELRTPLTSIRGAVGLLAGGKMGELPPATRPLLEIASQNCDRLSHLINDILDLERIQTGRLEYRFSLQAPDELAAKALEAHAPYGLPFGVQMVREGAAPGSRIWVDPDRLLQVLANLLSNAVKFSPPGGTVTLRVSQAGGRVRMEVQDRGEGIPEAFQARIFEKFAQAEPTATRAKGGSGLGLSIAKAMVEAMGGRIGFLSRPGEGTTFHLDFPEWASTASEGAPRILVVEDDPDVGALLQRLLEAEGFRTALAPDAETALARLEVEPFAALTVDLTLPGLGGIPFIRELRARERTRDLPVVVVSARASEGRKDLNGQALGVVDWLDKPIQGSKLREAVRRALGPALPARPRILHLEDDEDLRDIVAASLEDLGEVLGAGSLAEARAILRECPPDLVILDMFLPDGHGLELLAELDHPEGGRLPVMVFSCMEVPEEVLDRVEAAFVKSRVPVEAIAQALRQRLGRD